MQQGGAAAGFGNISKFSKDPNRTSEQPTAAIWLVSPDIYV